MPLFKTRDWWSVNNYEESSEECTNSSLLVSNITNEDPNQMKIIVGGFSGKLCIYSPKVP